MSAPFLLLISGRIKVMKKKEILAACVACIGVAVGILSASAENVFGCMGGLATVFLALPLISQE
jgi:cell division protein FtsW (lipid II flippase)